VGRPPRARDPGRRMAGLRTFPRSRVMEREKLNLQRAADDSEYGNCSRRELVPISKPPSS
jgi:hypothetical protein